LRFGEACRSVQLSTEALTRIRSIAYRLSRDSNRFTQF
jgi:hypothetical protein